MSEKKQQFTTPVGFAKYAYLSKPKQFTDDRGKPKGEPKYQIEVYFDPTNPDWKAVAADLQKMINAVPTQYDDEKQPLKKQALFKKELDDNDQPTGRYYITFKTGTKFRPGVFDEYGQLIPENILIGNESRVRVNYTPAAYTAFGGGVNLYLNAVQVVELVEYQSRDAKGYGFEVKTAPVAAAGGAAQPQPEDDLPF